MSHYHLEHYVPFLFFMKIIFFVYLQKKEKYSTHALLLKCGHLTQFFYSLVFLCRKNNVGVVAIFTIWKWKTIQEGCLKFQLSIVTF